MVKYTCDICSYTTERKSSYDSHNKSKKHLNALEHGVSVYPCGLCDKTFSNPKSRWQHENIAHSKTTAYKLKCDACNKYFKNETDYNTHKSKDTHFENRRNMPHVKEWEDERRMPDQMKRDRAEERADARLFIAKLEQQCKQEGEFNVRKKNRRTRQTKETPAVKTAVAVNPELQRYKDWLLERQNYFKTDEYKNLPVAEKRVMKSKAVAVFKTIAELEKQT